MMKLISARTFVLGGILLAVTTCDVSAGVINTRTDLNNLLGVGAVTEAFENWTSPQPGGDGDFLSFEGPLDSTKVFDGKQILKDGLKFTVAGSGRNILTLDRRPLLVSSGSLFGESTVLVVDFTFPITHAGFDFFQMKGQSSIAATIQVYGADLATPLYTSGSYAVSSSPMFFGYGDTAGIRRITLASTNAAYSPHIDDLTFGKVPEPSTLVMLGMSFGGIAGVAAFRRRSGKRLA